MKKAVFRNVRTDKRKLNKIRGFTRRQGPRFAYGCSTRLAPTKKGVYQGKAHQIESIARHIPRPLPVVIDTDPAGGVFMRDIDDVLALLLLMASPQTRVVAITVTYGNASLKKTLKVAHRICDVANRRDIPVLPGAAKRGQRSPTPAARFIVDFFNKNSGEAVLLTLGPLTNIATALRMAPGLAERIPAVVVMGGNMAAPFPLSPYRGFEFNSACDAAAMDEVLNSGLKIWLAPADLCMQARFGRAELSRLKELNEHCAALRLCNIAQWIRLNRLILGPGGFVPWDPVAAAMLAAPDLFRDERVISLSMSHKGWKKRLVVDPDGGSGDRCRVPMSLDAPRFLDALVAHLSKI